MSTEGHITAGGWITPKVEAVKNNLKGGFMVIAKQPIAAGDLVAVWGGDIATYEQLQELNRIAQRYSVQVEENLYLVTTRAYDPADYINHSCAPNLGMSGQIALVAMRDIAVGEEVCFDYAMTDGSAYDEFECACGAPNCRRNVTGDDWMLPELWERYEGYFSPYLQRRIDRLKAAQQEAGKR
jgi:uncharacterized protein